MSQYFYDVKQCTTCNNIRCAIYEELFKSLKHVECDIECFATTAFIMVHHYLAYTIVKMDIPAFVAFIYMYRGAAILFLLFVRSRWLRSDCHVTHEISPSALAKLTQFPKQRILPALRSICLERVWCLRML